MCYTRGENLLARMLLWPDDLRPLTTSAVPRELWPPQISATSNVAPGQPERPCLLLPVSGNPGCMAQSSLEERRHWRCKWMLQRKANRKNAVVAPRASGSVVRGSVSAATAVNTLTGDCWSGAAGESRSGSRFAAAAGTGWRVSCPGGVRSSRTGSGAQSRRPDHAPTACPNLHPTGPSGVCFVACWAGEERCEKQKILAAGHSATLG